jgi:hypothetical protein
MDQGTSTVFSTRSMISHHADVLRLGFVGESDAVAQHIRAYGAHILGDHVARVFGEGQALAARAMLMLARGLPPNEIMELRSFSLYWSGLRVALDDVHDVLLDLLVHVHLAHQLAGVRISLALTTVFCAAAGSHVLPDDELLLLLARDSPAPPSA